MEYYEQVLKKRQQKFTHNDDADKLIKQEPVAFLFAVILDQGAQAEKIWEIPYHLKNIMGHLDVYRIATLEEEEICQIF